MRGYNLLIISCRVAELSSSIIPSAHVTPRRAWWRPTPSATETAPCPVRSPLILKVKAILSGAKINNVGDDSGRFHLH